VIKTETKDLLLLGGLAVVGYLLLRGASGAGRVRRFGVPKTEAERRATHLGRYGTSELPPRGTGLRI